MREWESTIRQAQSAFQAERYSEAIPLNHKALKIACDNYKDNFNVDIHKAVASVMISYFSLANTYIAEESYDQAYAFYQASLYFIKETNKQSQSRTLDLDIAIGHAINKLKYEWRAFKEFYTDKLQEKHLIPAEQFQENLDNVLKKLH